MSIFFLSNLQKNKCLFIGFHYILKYFPRKLGNQSGNFKMWFCLRPTRQNHIKHTYKNLLQYIMKGILAFLAGECLSVTNPYRWWCVWSRQPPVLMHVSCLMFAQCELMTQHYCSLKTGIHTLPFKPLCVICHGCFMFCCAGIGIRSTFTLFLSWKFRHN